MAAVPSIGRASLVEAPRVAPQAAATEGLYERHAAKIQSYCHHQLGSREEAEDAVQTTFMNAFRALGRGVVPEAESAWLFKIAENVCLSRRRSSWRRGRIESPSDFGVIEEIVPGPNRQRDELIGIEDALASMPEQQRRAILLREWQGLSYREIAAELEVSQSAVETLIFRARRSLAQGLEQPDSVKPAKRKSFRRAMHALDLGTVLAALKTLLAGSAAVKATAAAVAVTAAAGTAVSVVPKVEGHAPVSAPPARATMAPAYVKASSSPISLAPAVAVRTAEPAAKRVAAPQRSAATKPLRTAVSRSAPGAALAADDLSPAPSEPLARAPEAPAATPAEAAPAAPAEQPVAEQAPAPAPVAEQPKHEGKHATPQPAPEPAKRADEGKQDEAKKPAEGKREKENRRDTRTEPAPSKQPHTTPGESPAASALTAPASAGELAASDAQARREARKDRKVAALEAQAERRENRRRANDVRVPMVLPAVDPVLTHAVDVAAPTPVEEPAIVAPAPEATPEVVEAPVEEQPAAEAVKSKDERHRGNSGGRRKGR